MTDQIDKFIQDKKAGFKFLSFQPGDTFVGMYKSAVPKRNKFNNDVMVYTFIDIKSGVLKEWEDGSLNVAQQFKGIKEDTKVEIKCVASDKINQTSGKPYKNFIVSFDGKAVQSEVPTIDIDDEIDASDVVPEE